MKNARFQFGLNLVVFFTIFLVLSACTTSDPWKSTWADPEFVVIERDYPKAGQLCAEYYGTSAWTGYFMEACVLNEVVEPIKVPRQKACLIVITKDLEAEHKAKVLEHEKAHCRGWWHGDPKPEGALR